MTRTASWVYLRTNHRISAMDHTVVAKRRKGEHTSCTPREDVRARRHLLGAFSRWGSPIQDTYLRSGRQRKYKCTELNANEGGVVGSGLDRPAESFAMQCNNRPLCEFGTHTRTSGTSTSDSNTFQLQRAVLGHATLRTSLSMPSESGVIRVRRGRGSRR